MGKKNKKNTKNQESEIIENEVHNKEIEIKQEIVEKNPQNELLIDLTQTTIDDTLQAQAFENKEFEMHENAENQLSYPQDNINIDFNMTQGFQNSQDDLKWHQGEQTQQFEEQKVQKLNEDQQVVELNDDAKSKLLLELESAYQPPEVNDSYQKQEFNLIDCSNQNQQSINLLEPSINLNNFEQEVQKNEVQQQKIEIENLEQKKNEIFENNKDEKLFLKNEKKQSDQLEKDINLEQSNQSAQQEPKVQKKKLIQMEPTLRAPESDPLQNNQQNNSSWSLSLVGNIAGGLLQSATSIASSTAEQVKKNYQEQKKALEKKKEEEEELRKQQLENERLEKERLDRIEAKRLRKIQKQKDLEIEKQQKERSEQELKNEKEKIQPSQKQQDITNNEKQQSQKKEIEQKKNKIIVDPLNPLASLAKIDNSQIKEETTKSQIQSPIKPEQIQSNPLTAQNLSRHQSQISNQKAETPKSEIQPQQQKQEPQYVPIPVPDNSDMISSVSFNTNVLYDQFDNLDSISQVCGNNQENASDSGSLDLKNISHELAKREKKIHDLMSDRQRMKNLLLKAKAAIDSINVKYKNTQDNCQILENKLQQVLEKNKELCQTLEIIQNSKNKIEKPSDVKQILCRVKVNDTAYTLVLLKNLECNWYHDSFIINIQEQMNTAYKACKQIAYPQIFEQQKQNEENLQQCMQQYEERLKRVNEYMEQSNSSYLKCQEELNQQRKKYMKEMQLRDNAISLIIEKSIDIKSLVLGIDEKAGNQIQNGIKGNQKIRKISNINENIQELESQIASMMQIDKDFSSNDQNVMEIRNHLIDIYQRIAVGLLKKHQFYIEKIQQSDKEWQETCDQLINEVQTLKNEQEQSDFEKNRKIQTLSQQLQDLKTDHYQILKANEKNTEQLKNELSNSLNAHYLKNILTSYFTTNDQTVQMNLLKVVFKVMKFSDEEEKRTMELWQEKNKSMMQKVWDFGL